MNRFLKDSAQRQGQVIGPRGLNKASEEVTFEFGDIWERQCGMSASMSDIEENGHSKLGAQLTQRYLINFLILYSSRIQLLPGLC